MKLTRVFIHERHARLFDDGLAEISVLHFVTCGKMTIGMLQQMRAIDRLLLHKCESRTRD